MYFTRPAFSPRQPCSPAMALGKVPKPANYWTSSSSGAVFLSCSFPPSADMPLSPLDTNETASSFGFNRSPLNICTLEPSVLLCLVFILHLIELIKSRSQERRPNLLYRPVSYGVSLTVHTQHGAFHASLRPSPPCLSHVTYGESNMPIVWIGGYIIIPHSFSCLILYIRQSWSPKESIYLLGFRHCSCDLQPFHLDQMEGFPS